jgi:acetoin:2,6-dichlorophenolindophenol oxidoreductase subunit beta
VIRYWQGINQALAEEMERDPAVVLLGEDVGASGGAFGATRGLQERFGPDRVRDTPISELAIAGVGVGAALTGLRPVVEIMFDDFLTLAMDQISNQAAKLRFMTGGRARVPLVVRTMVGSGKGTGPQHGQSLEAWLGHVPGLAVALPATPADARGLLRAAIRHDDPVVVFESMRLWSVRGESGPDEAPEVGKAAVRRAGRDVTLVSIGGVLGRAEEACAKAAGEGVEVELIDLRWLWPLDWACIAESLGRTGRLVIAHDSVGFLGPGAELAARAAESGLLGGGVARVAPPRSPVPFAPGLEAAYFPDAERIAAACISGGGDG